MKLKYIYTFQLITVLFFLLALSCTVPLPQPCIKDNINYSKISDITVHYDWDSSYRRGCSYMQGECFDLAIEEFENAIACRPNDEKLAKTYGMHFLGYFPHRELGISYYMTGLAEEAIKELERSIKDSPSSKAKYFLNEARKAWVSEKGIDIEKPLVDISYPPFTPFFTNRLEIVLKGRATDDRFVSKIMVNGEPLFIELSEQTIRFTHTLHLKPQSNFVTIEAHDLLDKSGEKTLEIIVDRTAPVINLSYLPLAYISKEEGIWVLGIVHDESGVESLKVNNLPVEIRTLELESGERVECFQCGINISRQERWLSLYAKDRAGNETKVSIDLYPTIAMRRIRNLGQDIDNTICLGNRGGIRVAYSDSLTFLSYAESEKKPYLSYAENEDEPYFWETYQEENMCAAEASCIIQNIPKVTLEDEISLVGEIRFRTNISGINIIVNNRSIIPKTPELLFFSKIKREVVKMLYKSGQLGEEMARLLQEEDIFMFGEIIKLDPGQNEIALELIYEGGERCRKTYYVLKKEDEVLGERFRLCLSVLPIEDFSEIEWCSENTQMYVYRKLDNAFIDQKRFQVVEREKLEELLMELDLSSSDLCDKRQAIRIGRLLGAECILTGFMRLGKDSIEIYGTIIDTETGKKLFIEDIYLKRRYFRDLEDMIHGATRILAMKIRGHFPLCKGNILNKRGNKIIINLGMKDKICDFTRLVVYRRNEFGTVFLSDAKIEEVLGESSSCAVILDKLRLDDIKIKDSVITK